MGKDSAISRQNQSIHNLATQRPPRRWPTCRCTGAIVAAALVVVACGGGGEGGGASPPPQPPPAPQPLPTTTLASESGRTTLTYISVKVAGNAAVWDAGRGLLHVVTKTISPNHPNSLVSIDPKTGLAAATLTLQGEAQSVALSADGQYLYLGFAKGAGIQRVKAAGLQSDLTIPVGTATSVVTMIAVSPVSSTRIAAIVKDFDAADQGKPGVAVFEKDQLLGSIHGDIVLSPTMVLYTQATDLHWTADASKIYVSNGDPHGLADLAVSDAGVSLLQYRLLPILAPGRLVGTVMYGDDGRVIDIAGTVAMRGRFADYFNAVWARAELLNNHKTFSAADHLDATPSIDGLSIHAFDLDTFASIDTITWMGKTTASAGKLYSWGTNGLAWVDADELLIASGSFAEAGGAAAFPNKPAEIASGTFSASNGEVSFSVRDIGARDLVVDQCGHLYVSTSVFSPVRANSVLDYDPIANAVISATFAGSEPDLLVVSDDCSAVYSSFAFTNSIVRLSAPDLTTEAQLPLGGDYNRVGAFAIARSIAVEPGNRNTLAVARAYMGSFSCGDGEIGVAMFDGTTPRSVLFNEDSIRGIKSLVWKPGSSALLGVDGTLNLFELTVDGTGVSQSVLLRPTDTPSQLLPDIGRLLYIDSLTHQLYSSLGRVFDSTTGNLLGSLALPQNASVDGCGRPLESITTAVATGKVFFVSYDTVSGPSGVLTLSAYDATTHALIDSARLTETPNPTDYGYPVRAVHLPPDRLIIATNTGNLVVFQGPMLAP